MIVRAILDHVPPVLGFTSFKALASSHGGKSIKDALTALETMARKLADLHLHQPIRRAEVLPNEATYAHFGGPLDVLLGEVVAAARAVSQ